MANPNWRIKPEDVCRVEGEDFQRLCFQIVEFERSLRHVGAVIHGPPAKYVPDKGMDFSIEIKNPPRISRNDFPNAVIGDQQGVVCFACKTGAKWRAGLTKDAAKPEPVATIRGGGFLTIFINLQIAAATKNNVVSNVTQVIAGKTGLLPCQIEDRITLYDANDIAASYANHPFWLDRELRQQLGIHESPGIVDVEQWRVSTGMTRPMPVFAADDLRDGALAQLRHLLGQPHNGNANVIWVVGPPGVGKTRLILKALSGQLAALQQRIYVSEDFEHGKRAILETALPSQSDIVLVVDECPAHDARGLATSFLVKNGTNHGTLFLIGPQEGVVEQTDNPSFVVIRIGPLKEGAARELIQRELGSPPGDSALVGRVFNLSEGYPWFTLLLARALRTDPEALPVGSEHWQAAELALAGPVSDYGGDRARRDQAIDLRARTLLAVILTEGIDWSRLSLEDQGRLGNALGLEWIQIQMLAQTCYERGILRVRQNWQYKYVTPNNLARMIATHLLRAPFSIASNIRRHVPDLRKDLYARLERLEVEESLLHELAHDEIVSIESQTDPFESIDRDLPLQFIVRYQPARVASLIRQAIESRSTEYLRADTRVRRDLVFALEHIARRRNGFEDAEEALFRLALAENESWANNATALWASLFYVALSLTHRPFEVRFHILEKRVTQGDQQSRLLALLGLELATSWESHGPAYTSADKVDGPWVMPTVDEIRVEKLQAWKLLVDLTLDKDNIVAGKSRSIVTENLRGAIRWGIAPSVMAFIAGVAERWDDGALANLREKLDEIRRYERDQLRQDQALVKAVANLGTRAQATGFHGRLVDVVGRWFPGQRDIEAKDIGVYHGQMDQEIAREGLSAPVPLLQELDWLDSPDAVRVIDFMVQAGQLDLNMVLLGQLVERARSGRAVNTLSAYLAGMAKACGEQKVDSLLRSWRADPSLALHTYVTILRLGPSDERVSWIIEDLENGKLAPDSIGGLALGPWVARASSDSARLLIIALAKFSGVVPQITALNLVVGRRAFREDMDALEPVLIRLVVNSARCPLDGMNDYVWGEAAQILLKRGCWRAVIEAAIAAISSAKHYRPEEQAWNLLIEAAKSEPEVAWEALAPVLEQKTADAYRVLLEARQRRLVSTLPVDMVMRWIGSDTRRGLLVANMCSVHEAPLNELARRLIMRFGGDGPVSRELTGQAYSTPEAVSSLAGFASQQLSLAREWAKDSDQTVATWGGHMVKVLEAMHEAESAREEFENREHT